MARKVRRKSQTGFTPRLNAPTQVVFLFSLMLATIVLIGLFVAIPFVSLYTFWIAIAA